MSSYVWKQTQQPHMHTCMYITDIHIMYIHTYIHTNKIFPVCVSTGLVQAQNILNNCVHLHYL